MNNTAAVLILVFLALTFLMSSYEKIANWNSTKMWLKGLFAQTFLKNVIPIVTGILLAFELLAGILCLVGVFELYWNGGRMTGFYGAVFSCIALLFMLFGQRLVKDYDGARTIAIYFGPAILAVFLLS